MTCTLLKLLTGTRSHDYKQAASPVTSLLFFLPLSCLSCFTVISVIRTFREESLCLHPLQFTYNEIQTCTIDMLLHNIRNALDNISHSKIKTPERRVFSFLYGSAKFTGSSPDLLPPPPGHEDACVHMSDASERMMALCPVFSVVGYLCVSG